MHSQIGDKAAAGPDTFNSVCQQDRLSSSVQHGDRRKQVAAGVADQNGFNNDDPAKAAIVFEKDLPGPPQIGEVLVRPKTPHHP